MSHNEIVSLLNVPENASLGANLSWLKRYLDSIEPTDVLQNLSIHLYQKDDPRQPPLIYNPSGQDPQRQDDCTAYPILYQRQKIGEIYYCGKQQFALLIAQMAKKIALLARRFQANILSSYYLGRELPANGLSEAAFTLDAFIEKAASARCPVVIKGGFGSEKLAVACAIHYNSPNKHRPFVEINCALTTTEAFKLQLSTCFKQAPGGCVYFHGIDELSFSQQSLLIELLAANTLHSEPKHPQINTTDIRLLLSTTQSLSRLVEHNTFSRQLYAELNFLHTTIPPLVQRKEDIDDILVGRIKQHRLFPEQELSTEAKAQFQNYHWPENDLELERT
ncbi:MAG: transcriptional regulator of acetoin/glycerol metabolism, partial [Phenylobacterium sp.]